ncbi:MAG: zinc ribbon domain-containing protein [Dehalococcoidia bacterium]|nr:MAG: zinc ribbon domain-containing protein [Dehalococcoidia bacterium]
MLLKTKAIIKHSLLGTIGFGICAAILGYIHTTENSWAWLLGFTAMGTIGGVTLGYILGNGKTAQRLAMFGAIAGALGAVLTSNSDYEIWLQITIIGVIVGIILGVAFALLETRDSKSSGKELYCSECDHQIDKNDNYCSNCGANFE